MSPPTWTQARITLQGQATVVPRARAQALATLLRSQEPLPTDWANALTTSADAPMPGPAVLTIELLENGQITTRVEANGSWTRWSRSTNDPTTLQRLTRPTRAEEFGALTDEVRRLVP